MSLVIMRNRLGLGRGSRRGRERFRPSLDVLENRALLSTLTVTNTLDDGSAGSLRTVVQGAASGDIVVFAPSVRGTITLVSGPIITPLDANITIKGPGASVLTVSGGGVSPILLAESSNPGGNTVFVSGLTLANGHATPASSLGDSGGAIHVFGSHLKISDSVLSNNHADGLGGAIYTSAGSSLDMSRDVFNGNSAGTISMGFFGLGGAIFNQGTATVDSSQFVNNQALGSIGQGGAIQDGFSASLVVTGSTFTNNQAIGTSSASGGAIYGDAYSRLSVTSSAFSRNSAISNGSASGGAIDDTAFSQGFGTSNIATITDSTFDDNTASGLQGEYSSQGGAILYSGDGLVVSGSSFRFNTAIGGNSTTGFGGTAEGGGIFASGGSIVFSKDSFLGNAAIGGEGPLGGGYAVGGAVDLFASTNTSSASSTIDNSTFAANVVKAGAGGGAYNFAAGGAIELVEASVTVSNSSFIGNSALGSASATGAGGTAQGGAIDVYMYSTLVLQSSLVIGNSAVGGKGAQGGSASGGGLSSAGTTTITDTLIAGNLAIGGRSASGPNGQGVGGGLYIFGGTTTLKGRTRVFANYASTSDSNIHGTPMFA